MCVGSICHLYQLIGRSVVFFFFGPAFSCLPVHPDDYLFSRRGRTREVPRGLEPRELGWNLVTKPCRNGKHVKGHCGFLLGAMVEGCCCGSKGFWAFLSRPEYDTRAPFSIFERPDKWRLYDTEMRHQYHEVLKVDDIPWSRTHICRRLFFLSFVSAPLVEFIRLWDFNDLKKIQSFLQSDKTQFSLREVTCASLTF